VVIGNRLWEDNVGESCVLLKSLGRNRKVWLRRSSNHEAWRGCDVVEDIAASKHERRLSLPGDRVIVGQSRVLGLRIWQEVVGHLDGAVSVLLIGYGVSGFVMSRAGMLKICSSQRRWDVIDVRGQQGQRMFQSEEARERKRTDGRVIFDTSEFDTVAEFPSLGWDEKPQVAGDKELTVDALASAMRLPQ
jgi:hypothetical protein